MTQKTRTCPFCRSEHIEFLEYIETKNDIQKRLGNKFENVELWYCLDCEKSWERIVKS